MSSEVANCGKVTTGAGEARAAPLAAPAGLEAFVVDDDERVVIFTWPAPTGAAPVALTTAEAQVLGLVRAGLSNAQIARQRGRSRATVANQVASIFTKLAVRSRQELFAMLSRSR